MIRQLAPSDEAQLRRLAYMAAYNPDPTNQGVEIEKGVDLWTHNFGNQPGDLGVGYEQGGLHGVSWMRMREPALVEGAPQLLLAVDMMQRGRGLEKQLLEALLGMADQVGVTRISLIANPKNRDEFMLYSPLGFTHYGSTDMGNMIMLRERSAQAA